MHFSFETDDALNTHVLALWNEVKSCNHVIVVYLVSLWHYFPSPPLSLSPIAVQMRWLQPKMITHTDRIKSQEIFQLETTISSENLRGLSLFLSFLWISYSNIAGKAHACIKAASPEEMKEEKKQATIKARKPKPVIKSCKEPIQATHWLSYNYHYILILIFHLSFFWLKTHADWFQRV